MTASGASAAAEGSFGVTKETYFWPNSVVGRICTETLAGSSWAADGSRATRITAFSPSWETSRTWPMRTPLRRTSPNFVSCRPARSASMVTIVTSANFLS